MTLEEMDLVTRRRLVQLACVAAWSDLHVAPEERRTVLQIASELALSDDDVARVQAWLDGPPPHLDPQQIPVEARAQFITALERVIAADGRLDPSECETLKLIKELVV
jgi:uncharacterized tellurite resistance protein B-like protein